MVDEDGRSDASERTTGAGHGHGRRRIALAGEKENEGEEQAGVGAVVQAPLAPTVMPLLQLETKNL